MSYKDTLLDPRLQKLVDLGEPGTDIMHGELKNLMYECETKLLDTPKFIGQLQENPEYEYLEGRMDALTASSTTLESATGKGPKAAKSASHCSRSHNK